MGNNLKVNAEIRNVVVDSVNKLTAFPDDDARKTYLHFIMTALANNPSVKALSYAVLDSSAYLLLCSSDAGFIDKFMLELNENYARFYSNKYNYKSFIFRLPNQINVIKGDDIIPALAHIHKLPEYKRLTGSYKDYKYSSCKGLFKGNNKIVDKKLLLSFLGLKSIDGATYTAWHRQGLSSKISGERTGVEKYKNVIETATLRYSGTGGKLNEYVLKQIIIDVAERCDMPYEKVAKKLGISAEKRRDILIEIIASMVFDRNYTFLDAVRQLQVRDFGTFALLIEVIVTVNMQRHYGYDFIINTLKVDDRYYDILVEIMKSLNRDYGFGFVETAKKFSIVNQIIEIRNRTGL